MSGRPDTYLWYGETGGGKTVQAGEVAKWEFERTGRITRLISADSGWDPIEHLIISPEHPDGIIEAWNVQFIPNPHPVLVKLSEGFWPSIAQDGKSLKMVPPKVDSSGGILGAGGKIVSQYVLEGLSTFGQMLLVNHADNQRKIGQDVVGTFTVPWLEDQGGKEVQCSMTFAKPAPSHYDEVQTYLLSKLVPRFSTLRVARVIWTGHEAKGDDDVTGMKGSVLGPATVGKAAVGRTAMKFGDTFHFAKVLRTTVNAQTKAQEAQIERRAYYEDHPDEVLTRMLWPAKLSFPLEKVPELRKRFPGGFVPMDLKHGLRDYFDLKYGEKGA